MFRKKLQISEYLQERCLQKLFGGFVRYRPSPPLFLGKKLQKSFWRFPLVLVLINVWLISPRRWSTPAPQAHNLSFVWPTFKVGRLLVFYHCFTQWPSGPCCSGSSFWKNAAFLLYFYYGSNYNCSWNLLATVRLDLCCSDLIFSFPCLPNFPRHYQAKAFSSPRPTLKLWS